MKGCPESLAQAPPADRWFAVPDARVEWSGPAPSPEEVPPLALALGMFDGVHRGHQAVLESAAQAAKDDGSMVVVLTFCPHPSRILRPDQPTEMLFPPELKSARLFAHGVGAVVWKSFDTAFAARSAEDFVALLREGFPTLGSVHVGENFRFGRGRRGDPDFLRECLAPEVEVVAAPRRFWRGEAISSTRLREALREGSIGAVNEMLGEPYACAGPVRSGKRLGRSIGFPTLNLVYDPECRPRFGVYVVELTGPGGERAPGVANYGLRPTVEESAEPRLEIHLFRPPPVGWDAGVELEARWLSFLRPEQRFPDTSLLREQIERDVVAGRKWFEEQDG